MKPRFLSLVLPERISSPIRRTAAVGGAVMLPNAHFASVYAKPAGRPLVDTFVTEVSQDTWIYLPWDMGLAFTPPIRDPATA